MPPSSAAQTIVTMWIVEAFREGGGGMYLILALAVPSHLAAVFGVALSFLFPSRLLREVILGLLLAAAAATTLVGFGAWQWSQSKVDAALLVVSPDIAETIRSVGTAEARWNLWFGLVASVIPLLAAGIVGLRAAPPESPTPPSP